MLTRRNLFRWAGIGSLVTVAPPRLLALGLEPDDRVVADCSSAIDYRSEYVKCFEENYARLRSEVVSEVITDDDLEWVVK